MLLLAPIASFLLCSKNIPTDNIIYLHKQHKTTRSSETHLTQFTNSGNVIIDFYADWCGPCNRMSPVIDTVANLMPGFTFIKINRDYFLDLAKLFNITSIPTLIFLKDGKEIGRYDKGPLTPEKLSRLITEIYHN
jgi:thioredoxin 1